MLKGITHVALSVAEIDRSLEFYRKLGAEETFRLLREDGSLGLVYLRVAGTQFIELFPGANGPHERPSNARYVHMCLEVDDI